MNFYAILVILHIEAETKWPPFCKQGFKINFLVRNWLHFDQISLKFVPGVIMINNKSLVQTMTLRRKGEKSLSEPVMVTLHICVTRPHWVSLTRGVNQVGRYRLNLLIWPSSFLSSSSLTLSTNSLKSSNDNARRLRTLLRKYIRASASVAMGISTLWNQWKVFNDIDAQVEESHYTVRLI